MSQPLQIKIQSQVSPPFKCQKCQHDSINDKELNGFDEDDFFHAKTSFFHLLVT